MLGLGASASSSRRRGPCCRASRSPISMWRTWVLWWFMISGYIWDLDGFSIDVVSYKYYYKIPYEMYISSFRIPFCGPCSPVRRSRSPVVPPCPASAGPAGPAGPAAWEVSWSSTGHWIRRGRSICTWPWTMPSSRCPTAWNGCPSDRKPMDPMDWTGKHGGKQVVNRW